MKYYQFDISEIIGFFDKKQTNQEKNRFSKSKSRLIRQLLLVEESERNTNQADKMVYIHERFIEFIALITFRTLFNLVKFFPDIPGIAHGDIKPNNLLLTLDFDELELVLTDYGTCGPDEISSEDSYNQKTNYSGTDLYLPKYRWGKNQGSGSNNQATEISTYKSINITDSKTTATNDPTRAIRTHGHADDAYAIGITLLELVMAESIVTLDPSMQYANEYELFQILEENTERFIFYKEKCPKLIEVIRNCLKKDPDERTKFFKEFETSEYFKQLSDESYLNQTKKLINQFFSFIPSKVENGNAKEAFINQAKDIIDKYLQDAEQTSEDINKPLDQLKSFYAKNIKPYFGAEIANHYEQIISQLEDEGEKDDAHWSCCSFIF